jgi:hypothetical protein
MRVRLWAVVVVLVAAASAAFAGGDDDARKTELRACVARLSDADANVRAEAAAGILKLGPWAVDDLARNGASLDEKAWTSFADACVSGKHAWFAIWLNAAATSAPEAHKRRLLDLVQRLDPSVGKRRSPEEVEKVVREYLIERRSERCTTGHDTEVAKLGRDAVPFVLALVRDAERQHVAVSTACSALSIVAEKEDVPALRELLLAGETEVAHPLASLQRRGVPEATEALLAAVAAGRFDDDVAEALADAQDKPRTAKAVRAWIESAGELTGDVRSEAAGLFAALGARDAAPLVEPWVAKATKDWEFMTLADSLTRLGSRQGLELSLRIATERRTRFPCMNPPTESDIADDVAHGLLPCNGFHPSDRWRAARRLGEIAAGAVKVPTDEEWWAAYHAARNAHQETPNEADQLDAIAVDLRKWWDASKDKLTFDAASGRWSVGK